MTSAVGPQSGGTGRAAGPDVRVFPDADAVAAAAARIIADALVGAVSERGVAHWATTGGSTPIGIYKVLAVAPLRDEVPWDRVHIWWGDDRCVPRDDPLSNVLSCDQILIGGAARGGVSGMGFSGMAIDRGVEPGVPIPFANVHAMPISTAIGEGKSMEWAAATYEAELRGAGLDVDAAGYPRFDILLLGMGGDGHILSTFPGSRAFDETGWVLAIPAPTHIAPRVPRLTLNPRVVPAARLVVPVVLGSRKADTVAKVLAGPDLGPALPAQLARRPGAIWLLDAMAASQLEGVAVQEEGASGPALHPGEPDRDG